MSMNEIAGIPYLEAEFDKNGKLLQQFFFPGDITDVYVMSHGWNNDPNAAQTLYKNFFTTFMQVTPKESLQGRNLTIVGVIWPSKQFDELLALEGTGDAQGGAAFGGDDDVLVEKSKDALKQKIERMKDLFNEPEQQRALSQAEDSIDDIEEKATARANFVRSIRMLLDPGAAHPEDGSDLFIEEDPESLMGKLRIDEDDAEDKVKSGGGAADFLGANPLAASIGSATGISDFFSGFKVSAINILNYTTYYMMKERAGTVGKKGVAPLLDELSKKAVRIHLIGHSFGGRLVSSSAAGSTTEKIMSMALLQAAFSHYGFAHSFDGVHDGFFRNMVDQKRVRGPILVTHTKNDKAVGVAYAIASRLAGQQSAALGDENDPFGGIGRNGAQKMTQNEVIIGKLLPAGKTYEFEISKFYNANADDYITNHGDVTGPEVASAVSQASLVAK